MLEAQEVPELILVLTALAVKDVVNLTWLLVFEVSFVLLVFEVAIVPLEFGVNFVRLEFVVNFEWVPLVFALVQI